jgi:copper(I)-binding protein
MRTVRLARTARAVSLVAFALLLLGCVSAFRAQAAEVKAGDLVILEAWARATPVKTGAAYITVRNDGASADRLTGVSSDAAMMAHLHETKNDNGVMQMRPVDGIDLPPHATVTLKPGGYHIMLMGLTAPLKEGDSFPLALTFAKAGTVTVSVIVKPATAKDDSMGDMKGMGDSK